jgi:hypothetical protein
MRTVKNCPKCDGSEIYIEDGYTSEPCPKCGERFFGLYSYRLNVVKCIPQGHKKSTLKRIYEWIKNKISED